MTSFRGEPGYAHGELPAAGILLSNLGTPDAATPAALRRYLRQFLSDPRVIEMNRLLWWFILHLFVLTTRPAKSAALYRKVWTGEGSPLLVISRRQAQAFEAKLRGMVGSPFHVALGMRYGTPSIASALRELQARGCRRILVLPLFPQYFSGTVGSTFDAVSAELRTWRWAPELRTIHHYHDEPGYVAALAASVLDLWQREGAAEKLLFSFHGIPQRYFDAGDPYFCHCQKTARLVAEALRLPAERYVVAFQSLFGREEWIKPYTDRTIAALANSGVHTLDVIAPGFSADCLETIDELDSLNREFFLAAGGERFRLIPCLNDRPDHIAMLADLALRNLGDWIDRAPTWYEGRARVEATAARERAAAMKAHPVGADGGPADRPQGGGSRGS